MTPIVQAERLSKSFGGLRAVDEVDFAVQTGSITGIIGPNGAGKTTFFNLISRALPATSGRIVFDGQDITRLQAHDVARRGLALAEHSTGPVRRVQSPPHRREAARARGGSA